MTSRADRLAAWILAAFMLLIAGITFVDVLGRYVIDQPLRGSHEMVGLAMGIMIFAGLPIVTWRGEHISVGLFDTALANRPAIDWLRGLVVEAVSLGALAFIAWRIFSMASDAAEYGERLLYLKWPLAPALYALTTLAVFAALLGAARLLRLVLNGPRRGAARTGMQVDL